MDKKYYDSKPKKARQFGSEGHLSYDMIFTVRPKGLCFNGKVGMPLARTWGNGR